MKPVKEATGIGSRVQSRNEGEESFCPASSEMFKHGPLLLRHTRARHGIHHFMEVVIADGAVYDSSLEDRDST